MEPTRSLRQTLGRILGFARPYRGRLASALALTLLGAAVWLTVPLGLRALLDAVFEEGNGGLLDGLALGLLGLFVVQFGLSFGGSYLLEWTGERVVADLRQRLYTHLHRLGLGFFSNQRTGDLTSRLTNDVGSVREAVTNALSQLLTQSFSLLGSLVLMVVLNWRLSLFVFFVVPPVSLAARYFGRIVRRLARRIQDRLADTTAIAEESISAIRVVKAFGQSDYETGRYNSAVEDLFETARRRVLITSLFYSGMGLLFLSALVGLFWYGGQEVLAGRLTTGDLVAFIFYALNIATSVGGLSRLYATFNTAAGASERLFELVDLAPEIEEGATVLDRVEGRVAFEGVGFSYETGPPVLHDLSFEVEAGETVALVGPSGAGKSTLLGLLPRFYDPTEGRIRIEGHDLRTLTLDSLRAQFGLVSQDVQLFGVSIGENIRYGDLGASDAQVEAAARAANAHAFIHALPEGYATPVGERGIKLSGGQRQRVAIARALLRDPAILLLDEATSALDAESERLVQEALDRLMVGRTTFVIAHRLATVRDADRILVLDAGEIVEEGYARRTRRPRRAV